MHATACLAFVCQRERRQHFLSSLFWGVFLRTPGDVQKGLTCGRPIEPDGFPGLFSLREMERGENANGQKLGHVREPSRPFHFQQDLPDLQDQLI